MNLALHPTPQPIPQFFWAEDPGARVPPPPEQSGEDSGSELLDALLRPGGGGPEDGFCAGLAGVTGTDVCALPDRILRETDSDLTPHGVPGILSSLAKSAFASAELPELEPDEYNPMSAKLDLLFSLHGGDILKELARHYSSSGVPLEAATCFIEWLSLLPVPDVRPLQTRVLREALCSRDAAVRLAAATGLSWLDATDAADAIREAARQDDSAVNTKVMNRIAERLAGDQ